MSVQCFMVERAWDLHLPGGGNNVGAMAWSQHAVEEHDLDPRPFPHLVLMTAAGRICLDCPESDPPWRKWTRTGEPPKVTVTPSLNINGDEWHGHLVDGVLTP